MENAGAGYVCACSSINALLTAERFIMIQNASLPNERNPIYLILTHARR